MLNVAVLVSGGGTNLQAILDAKAAGALPHAKIALVLASKPGVYALERASKAGVPGIVVARKSYAAPEEYDAALLAALREHRIDVVVLAGDVFDNEYAAVYQPEKIAALLRGIRSRFGVYACWGNHDVSERLLAGFSFTAENPAAEDEAYRAFFQNAGVQLLEDESVLVENAFYLVGRQDPQRQEKLGQSRLSPAQLLAGLDAEKPVFVIDHQPRQLEELAAAGADLALSGHTHNGQMFPGNLLIRLAWKNPAGILQVGDMTSCVTQGAGVWGPAMRVGTDSEVMLLHVRFAP